MKKHTTILQRRKILEEFNKSGLSKSKFCKEKKINIQTFYSWFRSKKQKKSEFNFIPLDVEEPILENTPINNEEQKYKLSEKIILKTNFGVSLEIPSTISVSWLSSLLRELA